MVKKNLPYLALAIGILSQITSPFFVRWAGQVPGPVFAFYRMAIGGLLISGFFFGSIRGKKFWTWQNLLFPILGGICTAIDLSLWNTALHKTSIANATMMSNTAPVWVVLASILFFKDKFKKSFWLGLLLAMGGAAVVLSYDFIRRPHLSTGDLFSLASGLFYGGYYLSTQRGRERLSVIQYLWVMSAAASLALLGFSLVMGYPLTGYSTGSYLSFIGAGVVVQCIAYVGVAYALGHLPAAVVSPTIILQPVLSALLAIPLFGEAFIPVQWIGMASVLTGVYLINRSHIAHQAAVQNLAADQAASRLK
jgi:drug/metabolite transporter (DMT)-like permease